MWFDKENREKKNLLIFSKDELLKIKDNLINNNKELRKGDTYIHTKVTKAQVELIDLIIQMSEIEMNNINDGTYIELLKNDKEPYIKGIILNKEKEWNPNYDQDSECECGHSYYRHFDSYENMDSIGCKYCDCYHFKPKI